MSAPDEIFIPVMLGYDPESARELLRDFSELHIFGTGIGLRARLTPRVRYHRLGGRSPDVLAMYLGSLANEGENSYYTLLVTSTAEEEALLCRVKESIESFCIVVAPRRLKEFIKKGYGYGIFD